MKILNINFTAIKAEKKGVPKGKLNVNNNIKLENIQRANIGLQKDRVALKFDFKFTTKFDPDIATMELKGELMALGEKEQAETILEEWKESKKVKKQDLTNLLNNIMNKCSLEVILLSRELDLPSPIPLPRIKQGKQSK